MRQTEANVRTWVADLRGGFDAGSGNYFDGQLDSIGIDWHEQDNHEHETYLSRLGQRVADTKRAIAYAGDTVQQAEKDQKLAERNYETARARLSGESPGHTHGPRETEDNALPSSSRHHPPPIPSQTSSNPTRLPAHTRIEDTSTHTPITGAPNYREPHLLSGRSSLDILMWLFVLLAVTADIAVFYTVLARLFRTGPVLIVAGTVGFTAVAIGICHLIGIGLQRRRSADRRRSDGLLWTSTLVWLALGCSAFFVRLYVGVQTPGASTTTGSSNFGRALPAKIDPDLLAALLFSGLYLASGLLAITASFYAFNPDAQAYRRAIRNLKKTARYVSDARGQHAEQLERQNTLSKEQARAMERRQRAYHCTKADVVRLKHLVRHLMATELQDPKALDLLMKDAPTVENYPESEPVS